MSERAIDPFDVLKRQVSYFLGDKRDHRPTVRGFLSELGSHGEIAIVGGMLRDILIDGYRNFASDVDLVVDTSDVGALEAFLVGRGGVRNKFGGYALPEKWKIDVWPLQRTWAHVQGHRRVQVLQDLLYTTFFNWDAILYLVGSKRVIAAPRYLDEVGTRYLDLNLVPNPNPQGSLIRTMRAAARYNATLSSELTEYSHRQLRQVPQSAVVAGEAAAYGCRAVLTHADMATAAIRIAEAATNGGPCNPFPPRQLPLPGYGGDEAHRIPTTSTRKPPRRSLKPPSPRNGSLLNVLPL